MLTLANGSEEDLGGKDGRGGQSAGPRARALSHMSRGEQKVDGAPSPEGQRVRETNSRMEGEGGGEA